MSTRHTRSTCSTPAADGNTAISSNAASAVSAHQLSTELAGSAIPPTTLNHPASESAPSNNVLTTVLASLSPEERERVIVSHDGSGSACAADPASEAPATPARGICTGNPCPAHCRSHRLRRTRGQCYEPCHCFDPRSLSRHQPNISQRDPGEPLPARENNKAVHLVQPAKLQRATVLVEHALKKGKLSLPELQSLIGFLSFCCKAVPLSRSFFRRLYDATSNYPHSGTGTAKQRHRLT
jgi:hypothetical protein